MLKRCPMHGIDLTTQMDIFYHAMNYASKGIIDASCCGAFKRRSAKEARQLIEDLSKCNYKAPSKASGSSSRLRGSGFIGLDRMTSIEAKLDAVMNKLGNNERRMHTAYEVGAVEERIRRSAEGLVGEEPYQVEETKYMNEQRSYHFKPNPNLQTHYTPALRNHENFSYGGGAQWALDLNRITSKLMLCLGSKNNSSRGTIEEIIRVRKGLNHLKIRCFISC